MKKCFYIEKIKKVIYFHPVLTDYTTILPMTQSHMHRHPVYHLVFVLSGEGEIQFDANTVKLYPNRAIVVQPNEKHIFKTKTKKLFYFALNFMLFDNIDAFENNDNEYLYKFALTEKIEELFNFDVKDGLVKYSNERFRFITNEISRFHTKNLLNIRKYRVGNLNINESSGYNLEAFDLFSLTINSEIEKNIETNLEGKSMLLRYVEEQIEGKLDLSIISLKSGYSKNYFCRLFKDSFGMTAGQYHELVKINKAIELLRYSNMNITQIAYLLGYTSSQHFSKSFKKITSLPPSKYKKG